MHSFHQVNHSIRQINFSPMWPQVNFAPEINNIFKL